MKKVKIDSPFTDGFNLESINEHPVTYNNSLNLNQINKNKNQKNGSPNKKERTVNLNLIEEEKKENKIDGIYKGIIQAKTQKNLALKKIIIMREKKRKKLIQLQITHMKQLQMKEKRKNLINLQKTYLKILQRRKKRNL